MNMYLLTVFFIYSEYHCNAQKTLNKSLFYVLAFHIQPDVAGATLMAAGSSAPELATAVIAVFIAQVYHATTCTYLKRISFN